MLRAGCTLLQLANTGRAAARPGGGWRGGGEEGYDEGGCQGDGVRPGVRGVDVSDRYSAKSAGRAETARLCIYGWSIAGSGCCDYAQSTRWNIRIDAG